MMTPPRAICTLFDGMRGGSAPQPARDSALPRGHCLPELSQGLSQAEAWRHLWDEKAVARAHGEGVEYGQAVLVLKDFLRRARAAPYACQGQSCRWQWQTCQSRCWHQWHSSFGGTARGVDAFGGALPPRPAAIRPRVVECQGANRARFPRALLQC